MHRSPHRLVARVVIALAVALAACGISAGPASAAKMLFGTKDYLHKLQDTDIKGPNGETLYLGYKLSHHSFIAPYSMTDGGYILGIVGQSDRYYPLDAGEIARLQAQRLLPTPLPPYAPSALDYIFGHLAWIILAVIAGWFGFDAVRGARQRKQVEAALPLINAGLAHHRAGNLDAAIAEYDQALALYPGLRDVLTLRADAHGARGNLDGAIADYSKIIVADAKDVTALLARGAAFEAKGLLPRAIDDFTRAIKHSKAPVAYCLRARAYARSGNLQAALKDYTTAIKKNAGFVDALRGRAAVHEQMGRADLAQADLQKAAALASEAKAA